MRKLKHKVGSLLSRGVCSVMSEVMSYKAHNSLPLRACESQAVSNYSEWSLVAHYLPVGN